MCAKLFNVTTKQTPQRDNERIMGNMIIRSVRFRHV